MSIAAGDLLMYGIDKDGTGHTAIAVSPSVAVHADPMSGVSSETIEELNDVLEESNGPARFRPRNEHVARCAATLAAQWADSTHPTPFSSSLSKTNQVLNESRVLGVTEARNNPELLKFNYDALYRVFKWASNNGSRAFSESRGTTCCAFVTACFQAARARTMIPTEAIDEIFHTLTENRNAKKPTEERIGQVHLTTPSGKALGRRPFPQYANAGGRISLEDAWELVMKISTSHRGNAMAHPHQLTTAAMFCDAKYMVTRFLLKRLHNDPVFWTACEDMRG